MSECQIDTNQLSNLKIEHLNKEYIVTLVDNTNTEILKGYGISVVSAINDLHKNLL